MNNSKDLCPRDLVDFKGELTLKGELPDKQAMGFQQDMIAGVARINNHHQPQRILKTDVEAESIDAGLEEQPLKVAQKDGNRSLSEASLNSRVLKFPGNQIIQEFSEFSSSFRRKYQIAIRLLSEVVVNQTGKAVQPYLSKLLQLLLNSGSYSYLKLSQGSSKPKVEFFDSALNYLTIYLPQEPRFKEMSQVISGLEEGLLDSSHPSLCSLFGGAVSGKEVFLVEKEPSLTTVFHLRIDNSLFTSTLTTSMPLQRLFSMLAERVIETLHRCKFQTSNVQFTVKSMIDILELALKMNAMVGQKRLLQAASQLTLKDYNSFSEFVEDHKKSNTPNEEFSLIEEMSEDFERLVGKYQARISVYKSELTDSSAVFMDFDDYGELKFISNRLPSAQFNRLKMKLNPGYNNIKVEDIFKDNSEVSKHFRHAVNGLILSEPIHFNEDGYPGELTFAYNSDNALVRTHVHIFLKESRRATQSFKSFLSVKSIVSSDSEKDINQMIKEETGINSLAKKRLIDIESETPGVTKNGWLELFVKNDVIEKYKKRGLDSTTLIKEDYATDKKNTGFGSEVSLKAEFIYSVSTQLLDCIDIEDYNLNLFELDRALFLPFIEKVFMNVAYFSRSEVEPLKFQNFVLSIQQKYEKYNNPFHNIVHGMNVMHYCYLLSKLPQASILTDLDIFILVLSGLCHDTGHRGFNNNFEIATLSKRAIRWNDKSPLENYHASISFEILLRPENNFLSKIKKEHFLHLRKLMIANILSTDIKEHFPLVSSFQNKLKSPVGFEKNAADVELLSTFLIHTSDFAGASKYFDVSQEWSRRCNREFSNQYREEGLQGIPQTPFMKDLDDEGILAKNEIGFLKVIVRPLYKNMVDFSPAEERVKKILGNIDETILIWEKLCQGKKLKQENKEVLKEAEEEKKN